jgi:hypothetical protein
VDVHCDDGVTDADRIEIDAWIHVHDDDEIDTIVVGARVVAVHGLAHTFGFTGTAVRHGDVVAELDEAFGLMRRIRNT